MKHSISSFAKEIRTLYPGDYDDLSDETLVNLWLKKYPDDINKIDSRYHTNKKDSNNEPLSANNEKKSSIPIFEYIFLAVAFTIFIAYFLTTNVIPAKIANQFLSTESAISNSETISSFSKPDLSNDFEVYLKMPGINGSNHDYPTISIEPNDFNKWEDKNFNNIEIIINDTYIKAIDQYSNFSTFKQFNLYDFADSNGNRFDYQNKIILKVEFKSDEGTFIKTKFY
jgi:hypothetical protein